MRKKIAGTKVAKSPLRQQESAGRPRRRKLNSVGRPKVGASPLEAQTIIREAALDLFSARNCSSVTTKDIAKATGFNTALIYYYFGSKEELFRSAVSLAVERAFTQFRRSRSNLSSPKEILVDWLDNHIREYDAISKLVCISIDYASTVDRKASIDNAIRAFYNEERGVLQEVLSAGIKSGDFKDVNVEEMSTFISTYLDGVFVRAVILKDFDPIAAIHKLRTSLLAQLSRSQRP